MQKYPVFSTGNTNTSIVSGFCKADFALSDTLSRILESQNGWNIDIKFFTNY
jgi:hypothetical protein